MTGKRPTPLLEPHEPLLGNYFVSAYPPFSCWNENGAEQFCRSLHHPLPAPNDLTLGLYVHIPFCAQRCQYCYYLSYDDKSREMDRYLRLLSRELTLYAEMPAFSSRKISFVYFGGGTPSLLSVSRTRRLMRDLQRIFPWTDVREVTFECAPKSITEAKSRALRDAGVTRVSLGVQQLNDRVLKQNGRIHLVRDVERAYEAIHRVGFEVVNLDLMVGMVGETDESFSESLDRAIELLPESITIYQLEIPRNTSLYRAIRDNAVASQPAPWAVKRARLRQGFARLERAGYTVRSAYAGVRDPARHQFVYQDEQYHGADVLGIGVSSFSYLAGIHHQNVASLGGYLQSLSEGKLPLWRSYTLGAEERVVREFVLQLKLGGVDAGYFREKFDVEVTERFAEPLSHFADKGWLSVKGGTVTLTRDGLLRVDRMIPAFYLPKHRRLRYS